MRIDKVRPIGKRLLSKTGPLYDAAEFVYQRLKKREDRRSVLKRYPGTEIFLFSDKQIADAHAKGFRGQFAQDHYLLETVFQGRSDGYFVEIGANHPLTNSNSYAFEKAGWTGWSFDPLKRFKDDWATLRRTPLFCAAISDSAMDREFVEFDGPGGWEHQMSGFVDSVRKEDLQLMQHDTYQVACYPLRHFLPDDVRKIDLALIDVEGAELMVIDGLGLDQLRIDWLLIENVVEIGGGSELRDKLSRLGYEFRVRLSATDDLFARSE